MYRNFTRTTRFVIWALAAIATILVLTYNTAENGPPDPIRIPTSKYTPGYDNCNTHPDIPECFTIMGDR